MDAGFSSILNLSQEDRRFSLSDRPSESLPASAFSISFLLELFLFLASSPDSVNIKGEGETPLKNKANKQNTPQKQEDNWNKKRKPKSFRSESSSSENQKL